MGRIVGSFGLKGQVKVEQNTDFASRFDSGATLYIDGRPYEIERSAFHKNRPLLKLKGVETIEAAEALKWAEVRAEGAPDLDEGEYLVSELVGLDVYSDDGTLLGKVDAILPYPAHDLLVIGTHMIPLIRQFVLNIDLDARRLTVHLIDGMMSD